VPVLVAVPELGLLVIAAAAMLLTWATVFLVANLLAPLFRIVPFIGGNIADAIIGAAHGVQDAMENAVRVQFQGATDLIDLFTGTIQDWIGTAQAFVVALQVALQDLTGKAVSGLVGLGGLLSRVQTKLQGAMADISKAWDKAVAVAADLARMTATIIPRLIQSAVDGVVSLVRGLVREVGRQADTATNALRDAIRAAIADTVRQLQAFAQSLVTALRTELRPLIREAQADANNAQALAQDVGDQLTHDLGHILELIGPIAAGMTVLELITEVAREVTRIARCTDPSCSYLGPQLGALNAIQDAALIAALAAIVGEAARDPVGAARTTRQAVDPFASMARDLVSDIIGRPV
jgi:hypothetical protein